MVDNDVLAPVLGAILFGAAGSIIIVFITLWLARVGRCGPIDAPPHYSSSAAAGHSGDIELQDLAAPQPARLQDDRRSRRRGQPPPYRPEDWERFPPPPLYSHELGENDTMTLSQDEVGPFPRAGIPRTRSA